MLQTVAMSIQAILMIGIVLILRKLFAWLRISKKYFMIFWIMSYFFLIVPWKVTIPEGDWHRLMLQIGEFVDAGRITAENKSFSDRDMSQDADQDFGADWRESSGKEGTGKGLKEQENTEKTEDTGKTGHVPGLREQDGLHGTVFWGKLAEWWDAFCAVPQNIWQAGNGKYRAAADRLSVIWVAGCLGFLVQGVISYVRLRRSVICAVRCDTRWDDRWFRIQNGSRYRRKEIPVYMADDIQIPVVFGYFRPCIYLPSGMDAVYQEYVVAHERMHIRRKDHLVKASAYAITCLHWFHPAVWAAWHFMSEDMEMACDEETVAAIGTEKRKAYALALLELSAGGWHRIAAPPAFGEGDMKVRIKNIMHTAETTKKKAAGALVAGAFLTVVFLTAGQQGHDRTAEETLAGTTVQQGQRQMQQTDAADAAGGTDAPDAADAAGGTDAQMQQKEQTQQRKQILTLGMVRDAFAAKQADRLDYQQYENGVRDEEDAQHEDWLNQNIFFNLSDQNESYVMQVSFLKASGQLADITIRRESDAQMAWIYTVDETGGESYPEDLEQYLHTKINVDDWLALELPKGYTLGTYCADLGYAGGALIAPESYETRKGLDSAPEYWKYAGFVGAVQSPQDVFIFENGNLNPEHFPGENHSWAEPEGVMDTISPEEGWKTLLVHSFHDLYTAGELGELEMSGVDVRKLETQSEYWCFYFVKESAEQAYVLTLSAKDFSRAEAVRIAGTVKIK